MQAIPSEFVCQLRPLMFVAGLGTEQQELEFPTVGAAGPAFQNLIRTLRQVLSSKAGYPIYGPSTASRRADYNIVLAEKNVRFPPRKARLPNSTAGPHSPISPFTPTSPLHPDGLMAPIWIRKHRELIPSVFVLVLRVYEFGLPGVDGSVNDAEADVGPLDKEKIERVRDNELINEIVNRKRTCSERGIKLAVVLLASRELLEDPLLDGRLSHIRRLASLDSRASLFVLSPVATSEVQNFVTSLKSELWEASIDYYREHGRRLRRKRSRPATSSLSVSVTGMNTSDKDRHSPVVLNNRALHVRYDFKAAVFAEFRDETEVSLKHFEDCYNNLLELFTAPSSTTVSDPFVQPRTKRWAEARVLADCINVKICKFYLYTNNAGYALSTYQDHVKRIRQISSSVWAMDPTTSEYWSWESKQHRIFGDLVEAAVQGGFQIPPVPGPAPGPPLQARAAAQHVPAHVLQHAGAYYLRAATASENRAASFKKAHSSYDVAYKQAMADPTVQEPPKMPAALAHEKTVSHSDQIIELYTKAYDHYKQARSTRMTLSLAHSISNLHQASGTYDTVIKFDNRISKTYRSEHWSYILGRINSRSFTSVSAAYADRLPACEDKPDLSVAPKPESGDKIDREHGIPAHDAMKCCLEALALPKQIQASTVWRAFEDLGQLDSLAGEQGDTKAFDFHSTDCSLPVAIRPIFWQGSADLNDSVPYQVRMSFPSIIHSGDELKVQGVELHWSDPSQKRCYAFDGKGNESIASWSKANKVIDTDGKSVLEAGALCGTLSSAHAQEVKLERVIVDLMLKRVRVRLHLHNVHPVHKSCLTWLLPARLGPNSVREVGQPHTSCRLRFSFEIDGVFPAYVNESFPLQLTIWNLDTVPIAFYLDAILHPIAQSGSQNLEVADDFLHLRDSELKSKSISDHVLTASLEPHKAFTTTIYLNALAFAGDRHLDVSITARNVSETAATSQTAVTELSKHIKANVAHPFFCDYEATWSRLSTADTAPNNFFELEAAPLSQRALLEIVIGALGPASLEVLSVNLSMSETSDARIAYSSVEETEGLLESEWKPHTLHNLFMELMVPYARQTDMSCTLDINWRRCTPTATEASPTLTKISIQNLQPPPGPEEAIITAHAPSTVTLHRPFTVKYTLVCPKHWQPMPIELTYQQDSAPGSFVFAGSRKTARSLVLHEPNAGPYLVAKFTFVATGDVGFVNLPRFRCWRTLETRTQYHYRIQLAEQQYVDPESGRHQLPAEEAQIRTRELPLVQANLPIKVAAAEDGTAVEVLQQPSLAVYVLPH